jgi:IclR family KDG regulon transcriptional repressor
MKSETGIQSVNRAMSLLSLFTHHSPNWGITEMSKALNLPKGTVHGFVRTLLKLGFLQQNPETRKYYLGLKIYELGVILAGTLEINEKASGPVHQLSQRLRLDSRIAIWDRNAVLVTLNISPLSPSFFLHQIGPRIPAYCTALGRAILAFLPHQELNTYFDKTEIVSYTPKTVIQKKRLLLELEKTRERGYSIDREETVLGLTCFGAPIFGRGGVLQGSISLSGDSDRLHEKQLKRFAKELLTTSHEISRSIGHFSVSLEAGKSERQL